jgi:hypothetical protein
MRIAEQRGGYLYQLRPDVIPQGWMTEWELSLWTAFYERRAAETKGR